MCRPKEVGGLGLRNLRYWNKALLCRLLWNIHIKKDSLWIKWVHHFYSNDFWNYSPKADDSALIKSVAQLRNELFLRGDSTQNVKDRLQNSFEGPKASIQLVYRWFFQTHTHCPWKSLVYKPGLLPKHSFSFWMFAHKKFLTLDRQVYIQDKKCVLCGLHYESFVHLFFQCIITKDLWAQIRSWLGMNRTMGSAHALLRAFRGIYRGATMIKKGG